jgi:histidine triad (HIT) family protein
LIIAKAHFETLLDIDDSQVTAVAMTTRRIAQAIQRALEPDGMRVSQFNGSAAGQTVFHYHVHLIPIRVGERPGSHGRGPGNPEEIQKIAGQIRTALKA